MIDPKEIPIVEPTKNIRFSSLCGQNGLYQHVNKHLFDRAEKWTQLFDNDLIAEAKQYNDYSKKLPKNSAFHRLAIEYQSLIAEILFSLCERTTGHLHYYNGQFQKTAFLNRVKQLQPNEIDHAQSKNTSSEISYIEENHHDVYQSIEACDIETKIQIIAKSFVRNGKFGTYILCSAYRPSPKISGKQVRKKIFGRWERENQCVKDSVVLAVHDKNDTY